MTTVLKIAYENCFQPAKIVSHFNTFFTTAASMLVGNLPVPFTIFTADSSSFSSIKTEIKMM